MFAMMRYGDLDIGCFWIIRDRYWMEIFFLVSWCQITQPGVGVTDPIPASVPLFSRFHHCQYTD